MNSLDLLAAKNFAAKCAVNIALLDGAARRAGKPIYDHLGLGFTENKHVTSFSIGIAKPEAIRQNTGQDRPASGGEVIPGGFLELPCAVQRRDEMETTAGGPSKFRRSAEPHFFACGGGGVHRVEHLLHFE